jgi:WD40 repeat protein
MIGCGESFMTVLEIKQHLMKCHSKEKVEEIKTAISKERVQLKVESMPKLISAPMRTKVISQPTPIALGRVDVGLKSSPGLISKESRPKVAPGITAPGLPSVAHSRTPLRLPAAIFVPHDADRPIVVSNTNAGIARDLQERRGGADHTVAGGQNPRVAAATSNTTGTPRQVAPSVKPRPTINNQSEEIRNATAAQIQQSSISRVPTLTIPKPTPNVTSTPRLEPSIKSRPVNNQPKETNLQKIGIDSQHPSTIHQTPLVAHSPVSTVKSPEIPRQLSTTKELAQQRAIAGTKSITSYFSPSPSPKVAMAEIRPVSSVSVNLEQRMERLGDITMPIVLDEDEDDSVDVAAVDVPADDDPADDVPVDDFQKVDFPADDFSAAESVPANKSIPAALKRSLPAFSDGEGDVSGRAEKRMRLDSVVIDGGAKFVGTTSRSSETAKVVETRKAISPPARAAIEMMDGNRSKIPLVPTQLAQDCPPDYGAVLQRMGLATLAPRIQIPNTSTLPVFRDPLSLINHVSPSLLPSAPIIRAPASPVPSDDVAMVGQDLPDLISEPSDSEFFDDYDPYFDTHDVPPQIQLTQTPKRKPIRTISEEIPTHAIPTSRIPSLPRTKLIELYQTYELLTDKGARKPYMSKRARAYLSHLGGWDRLADYENEIIHVDFTTDEIQYFKKYNAVPGRTTDDCHRFQIDYPDLIPDYTNPTFLKIAPVKPAVSHSDIISRPMSFSRQRHREELGSRRKHGDRELQILYQLKGCSTFNHASGDVIDFKFSPVNNQFAVCCNTLTNDYNRPGNLLFGDATKETVTALNGHADRTVGAERYYTVSDIRFSNDGQYLYSGSYDNTVKIWDMRGEMISCLTGHGRITALSTTLCSDRVLAVASDDGNVYLYDVTNPNKQRRTILKSQNDRLCGAFLVPGQGMFTNWMLAGYEARDTTLVGALYTYDIPTGQIVQRIIPGSNCQSAAFFHPSANHFVVGATGPFNGAGPAAKSVVRVFDPRQEKTVMEIGFDSPQKDINKVTISPCGFQVTSSGTDGKTFIWDLRTIKDSGEPDPIHILSHGVTKMVPPVDGNLEDWDSGVSVAEWLPRSDYLITGGSDGFLKLWDVRLGRPFVRDVAEFESAVMSADFNTDRDMLGVGESSGRVTFFDWHGPTGGSLRKFDLEQAVVGGIGNEGILAARELLANGRVVIRQHHGYQCAFGV